MMTAIVLRRADRPVRRLLRIHDTTLREGTQGERVSVPLTDELQIAARLGAAGFHVPERENRRP